MRMVGELDAGPILYRVATPLPEDITAGELHEMLSEMGAIGPIEALAQMEADAIQEAEQAHDRATFAPKLGRADARVDWSLDAVSLDRWIRGCDPWPAAWSELDGVPVQIFASRTGGSASVQPPGTVLEADSRVGIRVATGDGTLWIGEVKPAGRSRMTSGAWVAGRGAKEGDRFQ